MSEWYCDLTLDHASVRLIRDRHLEFNEFDVPLPNGQNVLYVRISPDGLKFAGVGHQDDHCWEWSGGWTRHGIAFGPQSVIYDRDNVLHILGGPPSVGYRYVKPSNEIVTCDATRKHPTLPIWDWTELDNGVIIGQGGDKVGHGDDPVVAHFEGVLRLLQAGRCHFINAYGSGDQACYACVREDTNQALTRWLTLDEIRHSPEVVEVEGPIDVPAVNRALWFGAYDRDLNGTFPANCRICWTQNKPAVLQSLDGKDLAYYVAGNPDGDAAAIERACVEAQAFQPPLPVLAYVPHGVAFPPSADWLGLEAYQKTWETLLQFENARLSRAHDADRPVVLIGQCYTSNSNNTQHLRPLVPVFGRFLRDVQHCKGFVAFSAGSWRATGYEDHPEVWPLYQELSSTITVPSNGGGGGGPVPISIAIGEYAKKVSRKDPKGFLLPFDITSDKRIEKISLSMEGDGAAPIVFGFLEEPDGRYVRGMAFKPVVTGEWFPLVKAWDEDGQQANQRGAEKVNVTEEPANGNGSDVLAPNRIDAVQRAMHEHPEIDPMDEDERGKIVDYACSYLGGKPWGRKARNQDGTNKNTDGMTYLRPDGKFEIIDVISGSDGSATWDHKGIFAQGENGWWAPHEPV